jgi:plasmid stabilization system protein ParE
MRIQLSRFVESDLENIADFIAQDNPRRAVTFIRDLRDRFREIGRGQLHYQLRPEIGESARVAVFGHYVVLFRIVDQVVRIERVVYGGRNLPGLFQ